MVVIAAAMVVVTVAAILRTIAKVIIQGTRSINRRSSRYIPAAFTSRIPTAARRLVVTQTTDKLVFHTPVQPTALAMALAPTALALTVPAFTAPDTVPRCPACS